MNIPKIVKHVTTIGESPLHTEFNDIVLINSTLCPKSGKKETFATKK